VSALLAVASADAPQAEEILRGIAQNDRTPVVDRDAETATCPACGTVFPGASTRCPDCGLNFGQ